MARDRTKPKPKPRPRPRVTPTTTVSVTLPPGHVAPVLPSRPTPALPTVPGPAVPVPMTRVRAEQLVRDAEKLRAEAARSSYALGLVLRELSRPEAYRALGYATFPELLEKRDLGSRMTAHRLITIVDAFDRGTVETQGVEKSYAVARYAELTRPAAKAVDVLRRDPPIRAFGKTLRLSVATARHVFDAIKNVLANATVIPEPYKEQVQRATHNIGLRLDRVDIKSARVRSVPRGSRLLVRIELDGTEAGKLLALLKKL